MMRFGRFWPNSDTIAIASRIGGNAQNVSTTFCSATSRQPPKKPEVAPNSTPATPEITTTDAAIISETRAPDTILAKMSRPSWSVPKI